MQKRWYDYLWAASALYLILGVFNILFAWLGLICFITPLLISILAGTKGYCNTYCGRGKLLQLIGGLGISRNRKPPAFLSSNYFRYGFLAFFMAMFGIMLYTTYLVFAGAASLKETVLLLWTFKLPWHWVNTSNVPAGVAQFAFGFYGVMLTSTVLGLITMILYKPRSWCVYCPMGTMTQGICKLKNRKEV